MKLKARVLPVLFWLLAWEALARALHSSILLVGPAQVFLRLCQLLPEGRTWRILAVSAAGVACGFFLSVLAAAPLAVLSHRSGLARRLLAPPVAVMRSVPVASFIILALVFFSSRFLSPLITFTVSLPVFYTATLGALQKRDPAFRELAAVFRVPLPRRILALDLVEMLPDLEVACKTAVGMCWKAGVAAEIIGVPRGTIGERLQQAKLYLDTADVLAWTALVLLLSACFEKLVCLAVRSLRGRLMEI